MRPQVVVLDFGSQYTQLIARKIREQRVYATIEPYDTPPQLLADFAVGALVLSGGPASVYAEGAPRADAAIFELGVPVLGICYGLQDLAATLGGEVARAAAREYGPATLRVASAHPLFDGVPESFRVWMSHGDRLEKLPPGFEALATSDNSPYAAVGDDARRLYGLQFHPEVTHTEHGSQLLANFLFNVAGLEATWTPASFITEKTAELRARLGDEHVVLGLSGGVDSTVLGVLLHRAVGDRLHPILVDNGLLREGEVENLERLFRDELHIPMDVARAGDQFLAGLRDVTDPEEKRRIIGHIFIDVFGAAAEKIGGVKFLAQGTLYPDRIESRSVKGPSDTIKTHHNVGGLPEKLPFELVEPLAELFKDEVRAVGRELGLPEKVVGRHPFPGPGLAVRCLGEVTAERLARLRQADAILREEIEAAGVYDDIAQALAVLLPVRSVGVMGDERTYEEVCALRCVTTHDFMTADWYRMSPELMARIAARVANEVAGINRVVYDVTSKPPATVEWE
ncbi:MAG: glutamine-hydrolyzing GMP synthase [Candidatus Coatesbacteria bacterium]|nr:MAG: glutamine-hydrolyzing GMP synthase [Candidatus Coatesbacteria bacterium]